MVRTRDFVLFLLMVAFLLIAIVGTEIHRSWRTLPLVESWLGKVTDETDYTAEVPVVVDDRAGRLAVLRAKVLERLGSKESAVEEVIEEATTTTPVVADVPTTTVMTVKKCASYHDLSIPWNPKTVLQENREGVRVYFERGLPDPLASTTPDIIRGIVPLRTWAMPATSCLPTDVIGVAMDGSLIRNDELALYTVFGADTIVGYALDGFPIYGPGAVPTDACGGAIVGGAYRYVLDAQRAGLITCFAATPARLQ